MLWFIRSETHELAAGRGRLKASPVLISGLISHRQEDTSRLPAGQVGGEPCPAVRAPAPPRPAVPRGQAAEPRARAHLSLPRRLRPPSRPRAAQPRAAPRGSPACRPGPRLLPRPKPARRGCWAWRSSRLAHPRPAPPPPARPAIAKGTAPAPGRPGRGRRARLPPRPRLRRRPCCGERPWRAAPQVPAEAVLTGAGSLRVLPPREAAAGLQPADRRKRRDRRVLGRRRRQEPLLRLPLAGRASRAGPFPHRAVTPPYSVLDCKRLEGSLYVGPNQCCSIQSMNE